MKFKITVIIQIILILLALGEMFVLLLPTLPSLPFGIERTINQTSLDVIGVLLLIGTINLLKHGRTNRTTV